MAERTHRTKSTEELAEDLSEINEKLDGLGRKIDGLPFVPREVYEARHEALRREVALELARIENDAKNAAKNASDTAASARVISWWALGVICTAVIGAIVAAVVAIGGT